jgi:hypothetical protein
MIAFLLRGGIASTPAISPQLAGGVHQRFLKKCQDA